MNTTISIIIPAYNAERTIAQTARAASQIPNVTQVIVVDDGSRDQTADVARQAGAEVFILKKNQGKGAALRRGLQEATGDLVLFLDADLGESARLAGALVVPVARGECEMSIADFSSQGRWVSESLSQQTDASHQPSTIHNQESKAVSSTQRLKDSETQRLKLGGFGFVMRLAHWGIYTLTRLRMASPISGQRCLSRQLANEVGIADAFGVEVGLTLEVARRGGRIVEVPLPMTHAATDRSLPGFLHRGRQFYDILGILLDVMYGLGWPRLSYSQTMTRVLLWLVALFGFLGIAAFSQPPFLVQAFFSLAFAILLIPLLYRLCPLRKNYLNVSLHTSFGILFFLVYVLVTGVSILLGRGWPGGVADPSALLLLFFWLILGILDDWFGAAGSRGFRGHVKALLSLHFTTGAAKLVFGGLASLAVGAMHSGDGGWPVTLLNGLLIALCTNFINLLDLRPGRALKAFAPLAILAWILNPALAPFLGILLMTAIVYTPADFSARAMLGDTGSNMLGAMAGLALVLSLGAWGKIVAVVVLIAIHLYAEKKSISALIDHLAPLRWLDHLGRGKK